MWPLALAVICLLFAAMAVVFGRQARVERRRLVAEAALAIELDGRFDTAGLDRREDGAEGERDEGAVVRAA